MSRDLIFDRLDARLQGLNSAGPLGFKPAGQDRHADRIPIWQAEINRDPNSTHTRRMLLVINRNASLPHRLEVFQQLRPTPDGLGRCAWEALWQTTYEFLVRASSEQRLAAGGRVQRQTRPAGEGNPHFRVRDHLIDQFTPVSTLNPQIHGFIQFMGQLFDARAGDLGSIEIRSMGQPGQCWAKTHIPIIHRDEALLAQGTHEPSHGRTGQARRTGDLSDGHPRWLRLETAQDQSRSFDHLVPALRFHLPLQYDFL